MRLSTGFRSPVKMVVMAACSLLAIAAVTLYGLAPVAGSPSLASAYSLSRATEHGAVQGVVKNGDKLARGVRITVVSHAANDRRLGVTHMRTNRAGRFHVALVARTKTVTVTIRMFGRSVSGTYLVKAGHTINLTAVFPPRRSGLVAGLFPY